MLLKQQELFGGDIRPYIYIMQDYEPQFYPFSSTHLMARMAYGSGSRYWAIINSAELHEYFLSQGHNCERTYVFSPRLSAGLRRFLNGELSAKARRILIYGRPTVPRNCFPAIENGLALWARRHPEFADWEVVSAGQLHAPFKFAPGRVMRSLGKLSLEDYASLLKTTAVGLSLMSSPHPSYPPLEMAHFGIRTITNRYAKKDLGKAHDNIISIDDVAPQTIADALALACREFNSDPAAGWRAKSRLALFLEPGAFPFLDEIVEDMGRLWAGEQKKRGEAIGDRGKQRFPSTGERSVISTN